jgi:hypothetical protein
MKAGKHRRPISPFRATSKRQGLALALLAGLGAASPLPAQGKAAAADTVEWTTYDEDGTRIGSVTLTLEKREGLVRAEFTSGGRITGTADLDLTGAQMDLHCILADGRTQVLKASADGHRWEATGGWEGSVKRDGATVIGDPSMFLAISHLLGYAREGEERKIRLVMPQDGRVVGMTLRYTGDQIMTEGPVSDAKAHIVEMRLSDPLGRLVWPYALVFAFRAEDGLMLRFENVDGKGRKQTMVLSAAAGKEP